MSVVLPRPSNWIPDCCFYTFENSSLSHLQTQKLQNSWNCNLKKRPWKQTHFLSMYIFLTCVYEYFWGVPHNLLSEVDSFAVHFSPIKVQK